MAQQAARGEAQLYGGVSGALPEVASPYAEFGHAELIDQFYASEGNPVIGEELSVRLFRHAGIAVDPKTAPLVGRNGAQVVGEGGKPLTLSDYVNYAAGHHFEAVPEILDFLTMQPDTPDYDRMRIAMLSRLGVGAR